MNKFINFLIFAFVIYLLILIFFTSCSKRIEQPKKQVIVYRCVTDVPLPGKALKPFTIHEIDSIVKARDKANYPILPKCERYQADTLYY